MFINVYCFSPNLAIINFMEETRLGRRKVPFSWKMDLYYENWRAARRCNRQIENCYQVLHNRRSISKLVCYIYYISAVGEI